MGMLSYSIADLVAPIRSKIVDRLVSEENMVALEQLLHALPGGTSSFFGFECDLRTPCKLDFLFCATQKEKHSSVLAGSSTVSLPMEWFDDECWKKVRQFAQAWDDENSPIFNQLENVWLEFDTSSGDPPHSPNIFFGISEEFWSSKASMGGLIGDCLDIIDPSILTESVLDNLVSVVNWLPENAGVFQVGLMLARPNNQIRLCLRGLSLVQIKKLVADLNFPVNARMLQKELSPFVGSSTSVALSIDVGEKFGGKVGVECYFGHDSETVERVKGFLSLLDAKNMCCKETSSHLIDFHGIAHQDFETEKWPNALVDITRLMGPDTVNIIPYWLHHIKVVYEDDSDLYAKAYLAVEHHRAKRSSIAAAIRKNSST